jgi:TonB-linked SusC/RagA family outer membrane protein
VESSNSVLVFSYIGYATEKVPVGTQATIQVKMKAGVDKELAEVAVVGFGTRQRKISLVGAQSTVKASELKQPVANITTMLAGRVAGVVGVQRSGEPGSNGADIWIRGLSTFGDNSSSPLVLVDGVERSIGNIDPGDIESFTILKDAAGTAVYGVRGANGVIFVKTKSGRVGKPQIYVDYNEGVNTFTKRPELMDGLAYMELANEALTTRGYAPKYSKDYIDKTASGLAPMLYPNVDWMDAVFNKYGHTRKFNLNESGGVENAQYYVSLGYYNESGFLKTDDLSSYNSSMKYNRYNFTSNLNLKLTKTTKLDVGVQGYFSNLNAPAIGTDAIFAGAMEIAPVAFPVLYPDGKVPGITANGGYRDPYADLTMRGYRNDFKNQIYSNVKLTQDLNAFTKGLNFTASFAFDNYNEQGINRGKTVDTYKPNMDYPINPDGSLNYNRVSTGSNYLGYGRSNGGNRLFYSDAALNYGRDFKKHNVGGLILFYASDKTDAFANDFMKSIPERYMGLAGRATYSYDDRYFAEFNAGYNGSELFAPGHRFGFFPAVGLGWVASNEKFFEPVSKVINFLKFRYSNGQSGLGALNNKDYRFLYMDKMREGTTGYTFGNFNGQGGIAIDRYGVNVGWSVSHKQDLGVELKTLNNKLSLIVDLFKEHRSGIFLQRSSNVAFMGLNSEQWGNLGIIDNKGVDMTLEYNHRIGALDLGVRGNLTYNKDILIDDDRPTYAYPWMERKGNNIQAIYGYVADGLFIDQKDVLENATPGDKSKVLPGDIKYKDLNHDGIIDVNDQTKIGKGDVPSWVYGFGMNVGYKSFNFGFLFQGTADADRVINGNGVIPFYSDASNIYNDVTDRWTVESPNPNALYPRLAFGAADNFNNSQTSSFWVRDMSFLRLKTAQLSYNLPENTLKRIGIKSSSIYAQGVNLLTFSKFKMWDPELNTSNGIKYPNVTTVALGLNLKF